MAHDLTLGMGREWLSRAAHPLPPRRYHERTQITDQQRSAHDESWPCARWGWFRARGSWGASLIPALRGRR